MTNQTTLDTTFLQDEYFSEEEAAEALCIAKITLAVWRMQRKGPPITKVSRRILYKKSSLKAWVEAQETASRTFALGVRATA
jgi:hypothetical protein